MTPQFARLLPAILLLLVTIVVLLVCDCGGSGPDTASPTSTPAIVMDLGTPQDAARSVLNCLVAERAALHRHDKTSVEYCRKRLRSMADTRVILQRYEDTFPIKPRDPEQYLATFVSGWAPIIGYYADGLQLDRMSVPISVGGSGRALVHVPASSPAGEAVISVECHEQPDGRWRVSRIEFTTVRPTSQPATAPAP